MDTAVDKKFIKKWVKALRSGKFTQTRNTLKDEMGYCCLGVAVEIINPGELTPYDSCFDGYEYLKVKLGFPPSIIDTCINLNDGNSLKKGFVRPRSFKQIADYIEKHYLP